MSESIISAISHDESDFLQDDLLGGDDPPPRSTPQPGVRKPPPASPPGRLAPQPPSNNGRLVLAIDYGTTFTGVAFATVSPEQEHAQLRQIESLVNWTQKMSNRQKVPSVYSYSKASAGEAQWGSDIAENSITMVNTKLELQPQDSKFEELDLTLHALKGMGFLCFENVRQSGPDPAYTSKEPRDIITDYLTKISECYRRAGKVDRLASITTSIDIVVTFPVNWSYKARDSMFKAIQASGFNKENFATLKDIILVPEPEAAAYYTAQDLRDGGMEFLEENDCFILCDAGGGTVDVVSYQVKKAIPFFELEKATEPTGGKFGSALIDTAFKGWLRDVIGVEHYAKIDPDNARQRRISPHTYETGAMRELIGRFNVRKAAFSNSTRADIKIELGPKLTSVNIPGRVDQGQLIIHVEEMKALMDECVNGVIELIQGQVEKIKGEKRRRVRNVLLVGGFGASPYLQEELRRSLGFNKPKMQLRRPQEDKSWTAVARGAVVYGIEKNRHKEAKYMAAITRSYGMLVDGQFQWLIRRGDLVISGEKTPIEWNRNFWYPAAGLVKGKCEIPIYYYRARDKDDDEVPSDWQDGQYEVEKAGVIKCDFSNYLDRELRPQPNPLPPGNQVVVSSRTRIGPLLWRLHVTNTSIEAELMLDGKRVAKGDIKIETDRPQDRVYSNWPETEMED